jgi:hypothetical protein
MGFRRGSTQNGGKSEREKDYFLCSSISAGSIFCRIVLKARFVRVLPACKGFLVVSESLDPICAAYCLDFLTQLWIPVGNATNVVTTFQTNYG